MNKIYEQDYYKVVGLNKTTDKYSFNCRMKCRVDGEKMSPAEYAKKHKIKLIVENEKLLKVKKCSNFPISRGMLVLKLAAKIMKMRVKDLRWLDPSAGWGDRLICAIKSGVREYYGVDPSHCMCPIYKKIIKDIGNSKKQSVTCVGFEKHYMWRDNKKDRLQKYNLVFTSPPFYNKEIYNNEGRGQSTRGITNGKEWFNKFFLEYVRNGFRHLHDEGLLILYVENHGDFKYVDELIKVIPYKHLGHFSIKYKGDEGEGRPYYVWRKNTKEILIKKMLDGFNMKKSPIMMMMVGFPGSGKTTFLKNKFDRKLNNFVMINPDELLIGHPDFEFGKGYVHKNDVLPIMDSLFDLVEKKGYSFIYDSNCSDIDHCRSILKRFKKYHKIIIGVYADYDVARNRIKRRAKKEGRNVPISFLNSVYKTRDKFIKYIKKLKDYDEVYIYDNSGNRIKLIK